MGNSDAKACSYYHFAQLRTRWALAVLMHRLICLLQEHPDEYYLKIFKELTKPASHYYFKLLPPEIVNIVSDYMVGSCTSISRALARKATLSDMHRRPPGPLTIDEVRPHFASMDIDTYNPIYDMAKHVRVNTTLTMCFLPKDDEPLVLFDTTIGRGASDFILLTKHGIYTRDDYDIVYCRNQFIPWSHVVSHSAVERRKGKFWLPPFGFGGSAIEADKFTACLNNLREALCTKMNGLGEVPKIPRTTSERIVRLAYKHHQSMYMYYYPAIPHHHLRALLKACECQEENILVMYDNAEFGAATIGLIVTLNGIYWNDGKTGFLSMEDLQNSTITLSTTEKNRIMFKHKVTEATQTFTPGYSRRDMEGKFLLGLQELWKEARAAPEAPRVHERMKLAAEGHHVGQASSRAALLCSVTDASRYLR